MPRECTNCSFNSYDMAAMYVNPADYYWSVVDGGGGTLRDPVDGASGLRSVWTYGGSSAGGSGSGSATKTIAVTAGASQKLSFTLDTKTGNSADTTKSTWGTLSGIRLTPYIGTVAQPVPSLTWVLSTYATDGGQALTGTASSGWTLQLATNDVGDSSTATQIQAIWGAGVQLPGRNAAGTAYTSYRVTFNYAVSTHDLRGTPGGVALTTPPPAATPGPAGHRGPGDASPSFAVVLVAAVALMRRRRR